MTTIRDNKPLDLQRWQRGERLRAEKLNRSVDAINRLKNGIAFPRQVRTVRGGKVAKAKEPLEATQRVLAIAWGIHSGPTGGRMFYLTWSVRIVQLDYQVVNQQGISYLTARVKSQGDTNDAFYQQGEFSSIIFGDPSLTEAQWHSYKITRFHETITPGGGTLTDEEMNKILVLERLDGSTFIEGVPAAEWLEERQGSPHNVYFARPLRYPLL